MPTYLTPETETEEDLGVDEYDWHEDAATLGDRLALARESQSMSQADLARRLGVRSATIANWETDRSEPRANRLQMLAGLLNVSIAWLMTGKGAGGPENSGETGNDVDALLADLRDLRTEQARLAEQMASLEKRLRAVLISD